MSQSLPFAITCVTCGSRLKVTNHDLIGSIDRCPKCGGMVQITAPTESLSTHELRPSDTHERLPQPPVEGRLSIGMLDDIDSAAITQTAITGLDQAHGPKTMKQPTEASYVTQAPPNESDLAVDPDESTERVASDYRHEVEAVWQSESTQKTKQLVLIGLLATFGLVTAGIVFSQFVRTWRNQQVATSTAKELASAPSIASEPGTATSAAPIDPQLVPQLDPQLVPPSKAADSVNESLPTDAPDNRTPVPVLEMQLTQQEGVVTPPTSSVAPAAPPITASASELASAPASAVVANPRDEKPEVQGDEVPKLNKLPPEMLKHLQLFTLETTDRQAPPAIQPPPTIDTVRIDAAAEQAAPEVVNSTRKAIDVDKSLSLQQFAIDNKAASLAELTLIVSQVTTVPIELELVSFDAANKRIDTPIKTPSGWFSARQWIDELCAAEGLAAQSLDGRMMISASEQAIDSGIEPSLRLDDFGDDATLVFQTLAPLFATEEREPKGQQGAKEHEELEGVAAEPILTTRLSEDGRSIIPGASLRSRMRAVFAIESLRLMRGMPPKLERWRTARWLGPWPAGNEPPNAEVFGDWKLVTGGKGIPRLDSPRTAASLIRSIASLNQSKVLVGWYDVTGQDLFPSDLLMPYSREGTAEGILDEVLGEHNLQARVCGPGIWYIGTEASYDRFEVFTWLPIPQGSEAAIRERLANSLSIADPSSLPIAFDGTRMLVRCPRYLARQMTRIVVP